MSAPSLRNITQTSQREFAGAKVQQKNDIRKKNRPMWRFFMGYGKPPGPLKESDFLFFDKLS